jgi:hypothetical protein
MSITILNLIISLCQLGGTNSYSYVVAREQLACQQYYVKCMKKEHSIESCVLYRQLE